MVFRNCCQFDVRAGVEAVKGVLITANGVLGLREQLGAIPLPDRRRKSRPIQPIPARGP